MANDDPVSITDGLPDEAALWPDAVSDACDGFECGDVVEEAPLFYFADTRYPVWIATHDYAADIGAVPGPEIVNASEYAPPYGIITSQTCDIGEIGFLPKKRPWVMVSPVYDLSHLDKGTTRSVVRGRHSKFLVHLPAIPAPQGQIWVADLRIEVPVEKSFLVGRTPIKSFSSDLEQTCIAERVAQLRARPAWAKAIENVCDTMRTALIELKAEKPDLWATVRDEIEEVGALVDSMSNPTVVQLCAFSIGAISAEVHEWWQSLYSRIYAENSHTLGLQLSTHMDLNECPVAVYRRYRPVPFRGGW